MFREIFEIGQKLEQDFNLNLKNRLDMLVKMSTSTEIVSVTPGTIVGVGSLVECIYFIGKTEGRKRTYEKTTNVKYVLGSYIILGREETLGSDVISYDSIIGRALMGRTVRDTVLVTFAAINSIVIDCKLEIVSVAPFNFEFPKR